MPTLLRCAMLQSIQDKKNWMDLTGIINTGSEQSHTPSTMIITQVNGFGKLQTPPLNGLIGLKENQTITTDNNACPTCFTHTLVIQHSNGMTGIAILLQITSARSHVP